MGTSNYSFTYVEPDERIDIVGDSTRNLDEIDNMVRFSARGNELTAGLQLSLTRYENQYSKAQGIATDGSNLFISIAKNDEQLGTDDAHILVVSRSTGQILSESNVVNSKHLGDIAYKDGWLYGTTYPTHNILKFNPHTGAVSEFWTPDLPTDPDDYIIGIDYYKGHFYCRTNLMYVLRTDDFVWFEDLFNGPLWEFEEKYTDQGMCVVNDTIMHVLANPNALLTTPIAKKDINIIAPNSMYWGVDFIGEFEGICADGNEVFYLTNCYDGGKFPQVVKVFTSKFPPVPTSMDWNNTEYVYTESISETLFNMNGASNSPFERVLNLSKKPQGFTENLTIRGKVTLRSGIINGNINLVRGASLRLDNVTVNGTVYGAEGDVYLFENVHITGNVEGYNVYIKPTTSAGLVVDGNISPYNLFCADPSYFRDFNYDPFSGNSKFLRSSFYYSFDTGNASQVVPSNLKGFFTSGWCGLISISVIPDSVSKMTQCVIRSGLTDAVCVTPDGNVNVQFNSTTNTLSVNHGKIWRIDFIA